MTSDRSGGQLMAEPALVVESREHLWYLLTEASQLEHMIMCQYLFAAFSLKQGTHEGLTSEQAEVVDRWRETLNSIAVQEMLHLALVANLSTAIGAAYSRFLATTSHIHSACTTSFGNGPGL